VSKFSKINISQIENLSKTEGNESYFSRKYLDSTELGLSLFRYAPNFRSTKGHSHKVQEEVYMVINGSGKILLDDEVEELKQWDIMRVSPEVNRAFEAGPDGLELVIAGGQKPPEGDGVMTDAEWPN
jgi:mannose-6-phosphate isomerase-like protein (cupin superfamily)